jgi:hypothetical protein
MSPVRLVVQLLLLLAVVVAGNMAVALWTRNSASRQRLRSLKEAPPADVLFLGNSLVEHGADCGTFEAAWPGRRALNLGLGWTSPCEHALLLQAAGRHAGADVVYGFFDLELTLPVPGGWADLTGNRAMAYYADLDSAIALYAPDSPLRACQMRLVSQVPILVERTAIWSRVEKHVRRRLGRIGLPADKADPFDRAAAFAGLASDPVQVRAAVDNRAPLSEPVKALFHIARARGSKVLVVEMPMRAGYRRLAYEGPAWLLYRRHLEALVQQEGGSYLVASDWVGEGGFADRLHLNGAGAAAFSRRLGQTLRERQHEGVARQQGAGR